MGMRRASRAPWCCRATAIVRELRYQALHKAQEYTLQFYICIYLISIVLVSFHHEGQCKLRYLAVEIDAKCVAKVLGRTDNFVAPSPNQLRSKPSTTFDLFELKGTQKRVITNR